MTNEEKKAQRFFMVGVTCDANMDRARERVKEYCKQLKESKKK